MWIKLSYRSKPSRFPVYSGVLCGEFFFLTISIIFYQILAFLGQANKLYILGAPCAAGCIVLVILYIYICICYMQILFSVRTKVHRYDYLCFKQAYRLVQRCEISLWYFPLIFVVFARGKTYWRCKTILER